EELRFAQQSAADGQHLLLTSAERACEHAIELLECGEELIHALDAISEVPPTRSVRTHHQILSDAQTDENAASLGHVRHAQRDDAVRQGRLEPAARDAPRLTGGVDEAEDRL